MRNPRLQPLALAAGVIAALVLLVSLFLPWYEIEQGSVTRHGPGGFVAVFGGGSSNAWGVVSATGYVLAGCALILIALIAASVLARSRAATFVAVAVAVLATGVAGYRLLNPPTQSFENGIQGAYFSRTGTPPANVRVPLDTDVGAYLAFGASVSAVVAAAALVRAVRPQHR